ncbi:MAG: methyltransferase domain-containing protein [bacterium]
MRNDNISSDGEKKYDPWGIPAENIYGHKKRLEFFIREIEKFRERKNITDRSALKILDVGCGTGVMITLPLASLGYSITGFDVSAPSIAKATEINIYDNARFCNEDFMLWEDNEIFDVIICSEVLEHVPSTAEFLKKTEKLLKRDGIIIITVPNGYGLFEVESFLWKLALRVFGEKKMRRLDEFMYIWMRRLRRYLRLRQIDFQDSSKLGSCDSATMSTDEKHIIFFTYGKIRKIISNTGLKITRSGKNCFIAGSFSHLLFRFFPSIIKFNTIVADFFPPCLTAGWYFVCEKKG